MKKTFLNFLIFLNLYKKCPICKEVIKSNAIKCKYCKSILTNNTEQKAVQLKEKSDRTTCPYCGEEIKPEAKKCKHCHEWLDNKKRIGENIYKVSLILLFIICIITTSILFIQKNKSRKSSTFENVQIQNDNNKDSSDSINTITEAPSCNDEEAMLYLKKLFIEKSWLAQLENEMERNIPGSFKLNTYECLNTETLASYDDIKSNKCKTDVVVGYSLKVDNFNENYKMICKVSYTLKVINNKVSINAILPNESNLYMLCAPYK